MWVTNDTPDEGRLLELILGRTAIDEEGVALVAAEPVLIVARMSRQPSDWALNARVWTQDVRRPIDRPWSKIAKAIHGYGVPTITLDTKSTPHEIACQVLLKCYWHGYIGGDEPALAKAVAKAYPRQVDRIQCVTRAPSSAATATTLLEQLIHPGFDPARGAEATRRYVRRKARIMVMEYRKVESPDRYPWTQIGIDERRYYKLLPLFAQKVNGRYDFDQDDVIQRMKDHVRRADHKREVHALAMRILQDRGFTITAARKWLQRHPHHEAVNAQPRGRRA
jgi:hypothetical protein